MNRVESTCQLYPVSHVAFYSLMNYGMGPKHEVNNRVSADCHTHSVTISTIIVPCGDWGVFGSWMSSSDSYQFVLFENELENK